MADTLPLYAYNLPGYYLVTSYPYYDVATGLMIAAPCPICCEGGTCITGYKIFWDCDTGAWFGITLAVPTAFNSSNISMFPSPPYNQWHLTGRCTAGYGAAVASVNGVDCSDPSQTVGAPSGPPPDLTSAQQSVCCGGRCPCPAGCPCCWQYWTPGSDHPNVKCCYLPGATFTGSLTWHEAGSSDPGDHSLTFTSVLQSDCGWTTTWTDVITGPPFWLTRSGIYSEPNGLGSTANTSDPGNGVLLWAVPETNYCLPGDCLGFILSGYNPPSNLEFTNVNGSMVLTNNGTCSAADAYEAP